MPPEAQAVSAKSESVTMQRVNMVAASAMPRPSACRYEIRSKPGPLQPGRAARKLLVTDFQLAFMRRRSRRDTRPRREDKTSRRQQRRRRALLLARRRIAFSRRRPRTPALICLPPHVPHKAAVGSQEPVFRYIVRRARRARRREFTVKQLINLHRTRRRDPGSATTRSVATRGPTNRSCAASNTPGSEQSSGLEHARLR